MRTSAKLTGHALLFFVASAAAACHQGSVAFSDGGRDAYPPRDVVGSSNDVGFPVDASPVTDPDATALDIGPIVTQPVAPPPLSGGTLVITRDGLRALAADPDRDRIHIVDLATSVVSSIALNPGDQPGRAAEDGTGHLHVVLRGAGAVATVDLATHTIAMQRPVCANPRGIAYDATLDALQVVCAGGEWVTLPAASGAVSRTVMVADDLRDIVVRTDDVVISRFRSAQLLSVGRDGVVRQQSTPNDMPLRAAPRPDGGFPVDQSDVAWRMLLLRDGSPLVLHQQASTALVTTDPSGYAGQGCRIGIAHPAISKFFSDLLTRPNPSTIPAVLAVDIAVSPDESTVALAMPGEALGRADQAAIAFYARSNVESGIGGCGAMPTQTASVTGVPIAVVYAPNGHLLVQTREPAALLEVDGFATTRTIALSDISREDSGLELFHGNAGSNIACASCHPEGGDDGHTWSFDGLGERRTQSLRGGILETAPFHWSGDMATFSDLAHAVLGGRMGGGAFPDAYVPLLANYVQSIPAERAETATDAAAVDRGRALFENGVVGCASCHSGALLTNNNTVDVGTGGMFQVPSLRGIRWRAPYLHNGCATTLRDRFGPCGGGESHGHTAGLSPAQLDDLLAYLTTL